VVPQTMSDDTLAMLWRQAKALAAGRMFKDVTQAEQAFAKMVVGHHLGLSPAQSMMGIDIVKGSAQMRGTLMGTLVRSHEGYDWKVVEMGDEAVAIEFFRDGESQGISRWTKADSERADLLKPDSNHEKYPRSMFWNRAMSQGVKLLVPEVMQGIPVYTPEDLAGIPASGAVDGEPGGERQVSPAMSLAAVELAVRASTPENLSEKAFALIRQMDALAPGSWSASKVEMVFGGKTARAVEAELAAIERQIGELKTRSTTVPDEALNIIGPAPDGFQGEVVEVGSAQIIHAPNLHVAVGHYRCLCGLVFDSSSELDTHVSRSGEGPQGDSESTPSDTDSLDVDVEMGERIRETRVRELCEALEVVEDEQSRSDIEAELDSLRLPSEVEGQSSLEI
jgi:hypothetical protein